jgi:hypothetical protein
MADILTFTDPDCQPHPDWLSSIPETMPPLLNALPPWPGHVILKGYQIPPEISGEWKASAQ